MSFEAYVEEKLRRIQNYYVGMGDFLNVLGCRDYNLNYFRVVNHAHEQSTVYYLGSPVGRTCVVRKPGKVYLVCQDIRNDKGMVSK